jgi:molybdopterin/thiamine biosynthesis adenylyltransferase
MPRLLRIAPNVRFVVEGEEAFLISENALLELPSEHADVRPAVSALIAGASIDSLLQTADATLVHALLKQLLEQRWLNIVFDEDLEIPARYEQVFRWIASLSTHPGRVVRRLHATRVAILGVGGLGTQVLEHLIGLGIQSVVLLDGDVVEPQNLNRQYLFTPADIGRPKVTVAAEAVRRQLPTADILTFLRHVQSVQDLFDLDQLGISVLINCADQPNNIENLVNEYGRSRKVATITGGVGIHLGYWGPLVPAEDADFESVAPYVNVGDRIVPRIRCTSSHGPYNSIIAALMAHDVFSHVSGCIEPKSLRRRMQFNFSEMQVSEGTARKVDS